MGRDVLTVKLMQKKRAVFLIKHTLLTCSAKVYVKSPNGAPVSTSETGYDSCLLNEVYKMCLLSEISKVSAIRDNT